MSGIVGGINLRSSGLVNISSASDGQVFTGTGAGLPVGFEAAAGGGKILQVLQAVKNDTFTAAADSPTLITGLSITITPAATSSKILVIGCLSASNDYGENNTAFTLQRDSTQLACKGDAASSRQRATWQCNNTHNAFQNNASYMFLDSPSSTSALAYKIMGNTEYTGTSFYVNRSKNDTDNANHVRGSSSITVMEIGA
jgi:hypothetical protein